MTEDKIVGCMDCGLPYEQHGLDLILPLAQWAEINPEIGGVLCGTCMMRRCEKVKGSTAVHAVIEVWAGEIPRWISVDERLPEVEDEYLVCGKGHFANLVSTLEYKNGKWYSDVFQQYIPPNTITHWMPLPEPPPEENKSIQP